MASFKVNLKIQYINSHKVYNVLNKIYVNIKFKKTHKIKTSYFCLQ